MYHHCSVSGTTAVPGPGGLLRMALKRRNARGAKRVGHQAFGIHSKLRIAGMKSSAALQRQNSR